MTKPASEADNLLRELWPLLDQDWDDGLGSCRFQCGGYKLGRKIQHLPDCIYRRIEEYVVSEPWQIEAKNELAQMEAKMFPRKARIIDENPG